MGVVCSSSSCGWFRHFLGLEGAQFLQRWPDLTQMPCLTTSTAVTPAAGGWHGICVKSGQRCRNCASSKARKCRNQPQLDEEQTTPISTSTTLHLAAFNPHQDGIPTLGVHSVDPSHPEATVNLASQSQAALNESIPLYLNFRVSRQGSLERIYPPLPEFSRIQAVNFKWGNCDGSNVTQAITSAIGDATSLWCHLAKRKRTLSGNEPGCSLPMPKERPSSQSR